MDRERITTAPVARARGPSLRWGVPAARPPEGIHMKFDDSNWILYDFDWSNQA